MLQILKKCLAITMPSFLFDESTKGLLSISEEYVLVVATVEKAFGKKPKLENTKRQTQVKHLGLVLALKYFLPFILHITGLDSFFPTRPLYRQLICPQVLTVSLY